jgi:hypothetical protein
MGLCPECGAENALAARACWMCGRAAWVAAPSRVPAPPSEPNGDVSPPARDSRLTRWMLLATAVVVIAGTAFESRGLAVLLGVVVGLPLLITVAKANFRETRFRNALAEGGAAPPGEMPGQAVARPMSAGEQAGTFFKWMSITVGSVLVTFTLLVMAAAVMVLSLIAAFFTACAEILHTLGYK